MVPPLGQLSAGRSALVAALDQQALEVRGDAALFRRFVECLDEFDPMFNIVEP
jgi:alkyl sulfatase BDS1-like metallo-beta-lactamase superfamily hydrolase